MNPMHQLTRRPVKAAFGALLLALAGVILALSGGQFWAAVQTRAGVEETYTTVAVVTGGKRQLVSSGDIVYEDIGPTYEANEFLKEAAQKGWNIIRGQATMGLAGGYSPKLTPLTTFYQMDVDSSDTRIDNDEDVPYNFAILEIEITEVGEERVYYPREYDTGAFFNWVVSGKVLGVQAMSGDWNDPTGRNANFYLQITGESDAAGKALQAGQRILVFTHNYRDLDFEQRCLIAEDLRLSGYEVDPRSLDIENNLIRYADRTTAITITDGEGNPWPDDAPLYKDPVTGNESTIDLRRLNTIAFNVDDCSQPWTLYDEQWNVEEQKWEWTVQRVIAYDTDYDLASFTILPEGVTAEEMIASSPTWQKAMESVRVSSHSVPVLAVNHLEALADFAAGTTMVTQGRSISQAEYDSGAAVCLVSESLARENGLNVGDVLPLSLYEYDQDLRYSYIHEYNPRPSCYLPDQGFQQETEYTIIGLYRQSNEWVTTPTSFTPNSVFVPEKSVTCQTVTGNYGVWSSLILQNGTIDQVEARLEENDLGGAVTYYDQGYSDIVESLDGYTRVSRTVLYVGLALWAVVLAAYCVLLPMQESKTALRMWTLGAKRRDIAGQIWTPSALMAAAGTVIALAVSIPGMSWATDKIQALTGSDLTLTVSTGQTMALCAGALAIALAVIALVSVSTARRGIRKAE
ncbi:MAG: ABC transporter permease [Oscillibacter sp.]|nr:ABC transporter permease [Oscillibacter sp.]